MKTHIINKTKQSFNLKEGNAGAYRFLKQLDPGAKYSIKVDPNATYREYMVATGKQGETIFLTSDDFSEYKDIDIVEDAGDNGIMNYKSTPRNPRIPGLPKASKQSIVGGVECKSNAERGSNAVGGSDSSSLLATTAGSVPVLSSLVGAGSVPQASSPTSSKPRKNERVPWYKKPKLWLK